MYPALMLVLCSLAQLPTGPAPEPLATPHFPDRLHAYVWRNWQLVPLERLAAVVGARAEDLEELASAMGLAPQPAISVDQLKRSYITIIRRNWHLLPYEQLLELLEWDEAEMAFVLQEDDFLFIKLGSLKPDAAPLHYSAPDEAAQARAADIRMIVEQVFGGPVGALQEPLFQFVEDLSAMPEEPFESPMLGEEAAFSPRFCSSYFALYGDPLIDRDATSYPDGYLARLAASGVNGVWLPGVLYMLAPFHWDPARSEGHEQRMDNLRDLITRAERFGIGVYMYLNEPRTMPLAFFEERPELKGVVTGDFAAMCTSTPEVQAYIRDSVAAICEAAPGLAGFFTITASENPTNCWSHGRGAECPRCQERSPASVVAEVSALVQEGIAQAGTDATIFAWDWGWNDAWAPEAIAALPQEAWLMSVSEWSMPIQRGGVDSIVGEYSISAIGPGPRATRHWGLARERGLKTVAKIQAGNTWELSAVPYIPAVANAAQHAANLRDAEVDGVMLGWTLGGYPSPNLDVVAEMAAPEAPEVHEALGRVSHKRYGSTGAVPAWKNMSEAFQEFPYHIGTVYNAPLQMGPANLLWEEPTGYRATMVGLPYDDLDAWRQVYPAEIFASQLEKVAAGFREGATSLSWGQFLWSSHGFGRQGDDRFARQAEASSAESRVARAAAIHFQSVANQTRFTHARNQHAAAETPEAEAEARREMIQQAHNELTLARELYGLQRWDTRIGFEATNHYFYVPLDLVEKVLNCAHILKSLGEDLPLFPPFLGDLQDAEPLPTANATVRIPAQAAPLELGPREIAVYLHYPGGELGNVSADTGLMLTLHNWGGTGARGTADPDFLANEYNVVAIAVDYYQSGPFDTDGPLPYDFGYLQALDALNALHYVYACLEHAEIPFANRRIYATGGSGGGNVALMANKLAPRTFAAIVDICGMARLSDDIAFGLPGGSSLNANYSRDPESRRYLHPSAQAVRHVGHPEHLRLMQELGHQTRIIVVHGSTDEVCPVEDKREMVANMQAAGMDVEAHFITDEDLDGEVFTGTGHSLGDRTRIVDHVAGRYLRPDSPEALTRTSPPDFQSVRFGAFATREIQAEREGQ